MTGLRRGKNAFVLSTVFVVIGAERFKFTIGVLVNGLLVTPAVTA